MGVQDMVATARNTWSVVHAPAANTVATASKAAGAAGQRHVASTITATFSALTTAPAALQVAVSLRDGATGAGTIIWAGVMSIPATGGASSNPLIIDDLNLMGSKATAMTLEFSVAGGANTVQCVTLTGYTISDT